MPPAGSPRPAEATYRAVAAWLETEIDTVALASPDPGRGETFHRLNRAEYHAAVRDLLAVEVDVAALLPADNTYEHGFDNNGDVLSISPDLVARYLSAARRISRLAVGIPPLGPAVATYRVHPGLVQDDRQDDGLSFALAAALRFGTISRSMASTRSESDSTGTSPTTSSVSRRRKSSTCAWTARSSRGSRSAMPIRWGRWPR